MKQIISLLLLLLCTATYAQQQSTVTGQKHKNGQTTTTEKKKFDAKYILLNEMYKDNYYPKKCVDKVAKLIKEVITYIEQGNHHVNDIQTKLDEMTIGINDLMRDFEDNNSEIETTARESIATTVSDVLHYFNINIDIEEALRKREW